MKIRIFRPVEVPDNARMRLFTLTLLHWFRRFGRDLPWRRTRDPYRILVSEFMLQQTQVERVKSYYEQFLDRFPTVEALANAEEQDVLDAWEGLGYYNRARNLHKTAIIICEEYEGDFPREKDVLEDLPGIGRYTAGAIVSFAFLEPAAILDTNVYRVLERVFVKRKHSSPAQQEKRLWKLAGQAISPGTVWEINQALIDFGAQICTAKSPKCQVCPMKSFCVFFDKNRSPQMDIEYSTNGNIYSKAAEPHVPFTDD